MKDFSNADKIYHTVVFSANGYEKSLPLLAENLAATNTSSELGI